MPDQSNEFVRLEKWLARKRTHTATVYKQGQVYVCTLAWETKHEFQDSSHCGSNMATAIRIALDGAGAEK